jgi:hypothetical protein
MYVPEMRIKGMIAVQNITFYRSIYLLIMLMNDGIWLNLPEDVKHSDSDIFSYS